MKSPILCVCASAMLLAAPVVFGEIIEADYDWDGDSMGDSNICGNPPETCAEVWAYEGEPCSYAGGAGYMSYWTTEDVECDFEWTIWTAGHAEVERVEWQSPYAMFDAYAEVYCPYLDPPSYYYNVWYSQTNKVEIDDNYRPWESDPKRDVHKEQTDAAGGGTAYFGEGEGIETNQNATAGAHVSASYPGDTASAWAESYAYCILLEVPQ